MLKGAAHGLGPLPPMACATTCPQLAKADVTSPRTAQDPGQPAVDQAGEPLLALAERQRSVIDTVQLISRSKANSIALALRLDWRTGPCVWGFSWTAVQVGATEMRAQLDRPSLSDTGR